MGALFNLPYAVMLAHPRLYLKHREGLLAVFGGAGRVLSAWGYGVLSLSGGVDRCANLPHAPLAMVLFCAINIPLMQQMRLWAAAPLTAVDALSAGCYAAFRSGSGLFGAGVGVAAGLVGLAVTAALERRCRAAFARAPRGGV